MLVQVRPASRPDADSTAIDANDPAGLPGSLPNLPLIDQARPGGRVWCSGPGCVSSLRCGPRPALRTTGLHGLTRPRNLVTVRTSPDHALACCLTAEQFGEPPIWPHVAEPNGARLGFSQVRPARSTQTV